MRSTVTAESRPAHQTNHRRCFHGLWRACRHCAQPWSVTTYSVNDMVLDNWGVVDRWTAEAKITSFGPSGIGFVHFGILQELKVNAPIETFGQGARGFNVYTGTVTCRLRSCRHPCRRLCRHPDQPADWQAGRAPRHRDFGGSGPSLVKGKVVVLSAIGLSIKPGGSVRERSKLPVASRRMGPAFRRSSSMA